MGKKGFAAMDPALQRELSRRGGIACHKQGAAHEFTSETAKKAGLLGAAASRRKQRECAAAAVQSTTDEETTDAEIQS